MFDTIGILLGVTKRANLVDKNGHFPKMGRAITADATASVATATIAMLTMPLTFSISEGIALGFITYIGIKLGAG